MIEWKRYDTDRPVNPSINDRFIYALDNGGYAVSWWCDDKDESVYAWDYITPPPDEMNEPILRDCKCYKYKIEPRKKPKLVKKKSKHKYYVLCLECGRRGPRGDKGMAVREWNNETA